MPYVITLFSAVNAMSSCCTTFEGTVGRGMQWKFVVAGYWKEVMGIAHEINE